MNKQEQINADFDNLNPLALEITKIIVNNLIDENTPPMEATLIFVKNYVLVLSSIEEIKSNPSILNDK